LRFVLRLRNLINKKVDRGMLEIPNYIPRFCSIRDLDELFTAPVSGFRDRADYYETCSSKRYFDHLEAPLWLITSKDDPFVAVDTYGSVLPRKDLRKDVLPTGGHLGYLHDSGHGVERWLKLWSLELGNTLKSN
jgi:predicted alpha/beta-fold hydrolase